MIEFVVGILGLYLVPLLPVASAVWVFGRKRVQWNRWDFAIVLLPLAIWAGAITVNETGKSLGNLNEVVCLGCIASVAPIIRVVIGGRVNQRAWALGLLAGDCLVAIGLWAFVPGLLE